MKKALILINAYSKMRSSLNQSYRLKEELEALGVHVDIENNDFFLAKIKDSKVEISALYDFVIYLDKDKYMSEMIEMSGIRLFNSHKAILDCDDKMCTYIRLADKGIPIVDSMAGLLCYTPSEPIKEEMLDRVEEEFGYPVIVKECYGSLGKGVYKCDNRAELYEIATRLKCIPHLFQRYIKESSGRDIRVIVIGGEPIACMVRVSDSDFRSNIELGGSGIAIPITPHIKKLAGMIARALDLDYAGIDLLFDASGTDKIDENSVQVQGRYIDTANVKVCEVNSNAFFGGIESVTHVNVAKAYAEYIYQEMYSKNDIKVLQDNVNRISITNLALDRCNTHLNVDMDADDIINMCKDMVHNGAKIYRNGKNWYVEDEKYIFTINGSTYMIITANTAR